MSKRIRVDNTSTILSHLIGLGLITKQSSIRKREKFEAGTPNTPDVSKVEWIEINPFGKQFIESCMSEETEELLKDLI